MSQVTANNTGLTVCVCAASKSLLSNDPRTDDDRNIQAFIFTYRTLIQKFALYKNTCYVYLHALLVRFAVENISWLYLVVELSVCAQIS